MRHLSTVISVVSLAMVLLCEPRNCQAGPLLDWLFGRRPAATPVTAYYPSATNCGTAQCQQTVLRYVPQIAYRTVWQPVPVTTYRRTVGYNPTTGLPITCTQPCTSYTYQARRVPYTTYRPIYAQEPLTLPVQGCNQCFGSTNQAQLAPSYPYYSSTPGYSTSPSSSIDPPGATPWEPVRPTPASPEPRGGDGMDPANLQPEIDPDLNPLGNSIRRMPSTLPRMAPDGTLNQDRFYRGLTTRESTRTDDLKSGQAETSATDMRNRRSPGLYDIRPLPDLGQPRNRDQGLDVPSLLDTPRDRTASRTIATKWESSQIEWPKSSIVNHQYDMTGVSARRRDEVRRLEPRRLKRFDSEGRNSSWPKDETSSDRGWRPAR